MLISQHLKSLKTHFYILQREQLVSNKSLKYINVFLTSHREFLLMDAPPNSCST